VGDQESGASAISIPVLNRAGIAQVSPTSTAVGLTTAGPGAEPGEPEKYYPSGVRTFARVAASDAAQAAVQVRLQRRSGCRRTFVVDDGEVDGEDIATSFGLAARAAGLDVVATQQFDPRATDYRPLATSIASAGADCVLIAAITDSNALALTRQLAAARPSIRIFGSGGLADSSYAAGLPAPVSARVLITSPALGTEAYPSAARAFLSAYTRRYGPPEPDAILGYEAMRLMLDAISRATDGGQKEAERSKVVEALFATRARRSVLGTYGIRADGDTTSTRIGVWTVVAGRLRFRAAVDG
jgi:branched-chain amino acid transport system substrate-binding protein